VGEFLPVVQYRNIAGIRCSLRQITLASSFAGDCASSIRPRRSIYAMSVEMVVGIFRRCYTADYRLGPSDDTSLSAVGRLM